MAKKFLRLEVEPHNIHELINLEIRPVATFRHEEAVAFSFLVV